MNASSSLGTSPSTILDEFDHWQSVRQGLLQALDMVTDEQLGFVPGPGLWSLGTVARHIANAEDGWFRYVTAGELDEWPPLIEEWNIEPPRTAGPYSNVSRMRLVDSTIRWSRDRRSGAKASPVRCCRPWM